MSDFGRRARGCQSDSKRIVGRRSVAVVHGDRAHHRSCGIEHDIPIDSVAELHRSCIVIKSHCTGTVAKAKAHHRTFGAHPIAGIAKDQISSTGLKGACKSGSAGTSARHTGIKPIRAVTPSQPVRGRMPSQFTLLSNGRGAQA